MSNEIKVDVSHEAHQVSYAIQLAVADIRDEMSRPSVLFRPTLGKDGDRYKMYYGVPELGGCVGFGETPEAASRDFDKNWREARADVLSAREYEFLEHVLGKHENHYCCVTDTPLDVVRNLMRLDYLADNNGRPTVFHVTPAGIAALTRNKPQVMT